MQLQILKQKKIEGLQKSISLLEWDIPNITNKEIKETKIAALIAFKKELENLKMIGGGHHEL